MLEYQKQVFKDLADLMAEARADARAFSLANSAGGTSRT